MHQEKPYQPLVETPVKDPANSSIFYYTILYHTIRYCTILCDPRLQQAEAADEQEARHVVLSSGVPRDSNIP